MAEPAASVWAVLLPVMVGGGLTLIGTAVGPLVSLWWNEKRNSERKREERLEQLLTHILEYEEWLQKKRSELVFMGPPVTETPPINKAVTITTLYIPEAKDLVSEIENLSRVYLVWMTSAAQRRTNGDANFSDGMSIAFTPYWNKVLAVQNLIGILANKRKPKGRMERLLTRIRANSMF